MHDPGEHSSPVRLPFGSFPAINILLSHTDFLLQTNRAACTLFPVAFVCGLQTMQAGKVSNYDSEQDHQPECGSRLYGIFSKNVFSFWIFCWNGKKKVSLFCDKRRKFYLSFSRAGIPVIPAFFYTWKERLPGFGKPRRLLVIFVF